MALWHFGLKLMHSWLVDIVHVVNQDYVMDQFKGTHIMISLTFAHTDTHTRPITKQILDHTLSHQTPYYCHCRPMGFISASFKTTTLIPTPTLESLMLSVEEETTFA